MNAVRADDVKSADQASLEEIPQHATTRARSSSLTVRSAELPSVAQTGGRDCRGPITA